MPRQTHGLWWARYSTKCSAITGCAAPSASASSPILDSVIDMRPADVANKAIEYGMASQYSANGEKLTANAILRGMTKMTAAPPLKKCWPNWRSSTRP